MKRVFMAASIAVSLAASPLALAGGDRDLGRIYTECGLGALIAQSVQEKSTGDLLAVITNITWDLGTTAISSNLTTPESCARGDAKTAAFILKSYAQLEKDLARGNGRYLDALAEVAEIAPEQKADFVQAVRAGLASAVARKDYETLSLVEKAELLYQVVISRS